MKKYLLLLAAFGLFFFSSCSNDDDGGENTEYSIIGTWEVTAIESVAPVDPNQCDNNTSTITFNENNTVDSTFYFELNGCEENSASGTWQKTGDDTYVMELGSLGELEGTVNFINSEEFTFTTVIVIEQLDLPATFTFEKL